MYLAEDTLLRRRVAIKFPRDPDSLMDRLLQEARAACQLDHPHIARILEAGTTDDGRLFVVMEYVEGETLAEAIQKGPLPAARSREVVSQILDALEQAHTHNIVHRDIKPANIMLAAQGAKVLDFGLAKQARAVRAAAGGVGESTYSLTEDSTKSAAVMGTPAYMSPEQLAGEKVDGRSDVFSCGVVLYECLTGRRPFAGRGPMLHGAILYQDPEPMPGIEPALAAVVAKALQKNAFARYQTAREMSDALRLPVVSGSLETMTGVVAPGRGRRAVMGAVGLALAIGAGWWLTKPEVSAPAPAAARWHQQGVEALRDGTYYSAARALEQLTAADPGFALGHARLAEAWMELDSPEKAQRELLLARRSVGGWRRRAPVVELTINAVENIVLREYSAAADSYRLLLKETAGAEQAGVWLDLGRVQQKMNENAAAVESFTRSIAIDPTHAAAWLLRGVVQGARQQFGPAATDLKQAQGIFEASQNFEGQAELAYWQGRLASMAKDLPAARVGLERALDLATKSGDEFHQVRAMSQLSVVTYMEGNAAGAQELAGRARERAREARLPYLTVQAVVDFGNAQLTRLDLAGAEVTLREAVALAQRDNLPRSEARARMSLGSVLVQGLRDEEAIPEINAAMGYYGKGQFRQEMGVGRMLLGRVYRRRGEFARVHQILGDTLREATLAGDKGGVSGAVGEIANVDMAAERPVEALRGFEKWFELVKDSKTVGDVGYSLAGQAAMWMTVGNLDRARAKIAEAEARGGASESVGRQVQFLRGELLYREGDWAGCAVANERALREKRVSANEEMLARARQFECLVFGGKLNEARRFADGFAPSAKDGRNSRNAEWLLTVATLIEPDLKRELATLAGPLEYFRKRDQFESIWMGEAIAAFLCRRGGDSAGFETHSQASAAARSSFEARLGPELRTQYSSLALVRQYQKLANP